MTEDRQPESEDLHRDFFTQGDHGTYEGGPATVPPPEALSDLLDVDVERRVSRTPEQEARRVRFAQIVAIIVGFLLSIPAFLLVKNMMLAKSDPQPVEDEIDVAPLSDLHPPPPAPVKPPDEAVSPSPEANDSADDEGGDDEPVGEGSANEPGPPSAAPDVPGDLPPLPSPRTPAPAPASPARPTDVVGRPAAPSPPPPPVAPEPPPPAAEKPPTASFEPI